MSTTNKARKLEANVAKHKEAESVYDGMDEETLHEAVLLEDEINHCRVVLRLVNHQICSQLEVGEVQEMLTEELTRTADMMSRAVEKLMGLRKAAVAAA